MAEHIIEKFSLWDGADIVLEYIGAEPCVQAGVYAAKKGGVYVQAGMGKEVGGLFKRMIGVGMLTIMERSFPNRNCMH